ncbi:uncharacterized protein LOC108441264 [Pygocentrus nattereri]|uniref:uncharacterized protein LOC108441264 n=1 Tax=Pygocentrus nattereri TaxID=42514 RepID=UPI00081453BB|nr:uncharacterized protein LOC108441264 [Pygocentrus nattereri]
MQARLGVEMLAVLVVVSLAASGGEGLTKCELRQELNVGLPATVLDRIKNEMAKIVCNVELITAFNTSAVTNITIHEKQHGSRPARSAPRMGSEESSEEVPRKPRPGFGSSTIRPTTSSQGNASATGRARVARHATSARGSNSEESHENEHNKPQLGFNTSTSTAHPQSTGRGHDRRRVRSPHGSSEESNEESSQESVQESSQESSEESSEDDIMHYFAHIIPPTGSQSSDSLPRRGQRHARAARRSNSGESNDPEEWTLYGLFQLPGPVACNSGSGFSLNLCNMTCNSLLDSNITNDISCLGTIINKLLPEGKKPTHDEKAVLKLFGFVHKECNTAVNSHYFSHC